MVISCKYEVLTEANLNVETQPVLYTSLMTHTTTTIIYLWTALRPMGVRQRFHHIGAPLLLSSAELYVHFVVINCRCHVALHWMVWI